MAADYLRREFETATFLPEDEVIQGAGTNDAEFFRKVIARICPMSADEHFVPAAPGELGLSDVVRESAAYHSIGGSIISAEEEHRGWAEMLFETPSLSHTPIERIKHKLHPNRAKVSITVVRKMPIDPSGYGSGHSSEQNYN